MCVSNRNVCTHSCRISSKQLWMITKVLDKSSKSNDHKITNNKNLDKSFWVRKDFTTWKDNKFSWEHIIPHTENISNISSKNISPYSGRGLIYSYHKIQLGVYFSWGSQQQQNQWDIHSYPEKDLLWGIGSSKMPHNSYFGGQRKPVLQPRPKAWCREKISKTQGHSQQSNSWRECVVV